VRGLCLGVMRLLLLRASPRLDRARWGEDSSVKSRVVDRIRCDNRESYHQIHSPRPPMPLTIAPPHRLTQARKLPAPHVACKWFAEGQVLKTRLTNRVPLSLHAYAVNSDKGLAAEDITPHRLSSFSECLSSWIISERHGRALDCVATPDGAIHVLTTPLAIHTYAPPDYARYDRTDLSDYLAVLRAFGSQVTYKDGVQFQLAYGFGSN
jgi:hypothetical protein